MAKERIDEQLDGVIAFYAKEVTEEVKLIAAEIAEEARKRIRNASPKKTGKYKRGWEAKKVYEDANEVRWEIHNKRYQLTHLLEHGHLTRNGLMVAPRVHIRPAELWAQKEFVKRVKKAVQK